VSRQVRVAHVLTNLGRGGPQGWVLRCARGASPDFSVHVIAGPGDPGQPSRLDEAREGLGPSLRLVGSLRRELSPAQDVRALIVLVRLFRSERYDVVHTHMTKAGVLGRLAAVVSGVPVIVHTEHGLSFHHDRRVSRRRAFDTVERLGARWSDAVLAVSDADREALLGEIRLPRHLVRSGRQGVDPLPSGRPSTGDRHAARHRLGLSDSGVVYGTVTRLVETKRVADLVRAVPAISALHPDSTCVVVGSGPALASLQHLATELGVAQGVLFRPAETSVGDVLAAFDVFVHPSQFEGLPMVVLEVLAVGLPVVAQDAGGTREVVRDGVTGRLVRIGDVRALADAVAGLLDEPAVAARLGTAGQALVSAGYRADVNARAIEAVYAERLATSGRTMTKKIGPIRSILAIRNPAPVSSDVMSARR
jgi:glycosyltransferase involved in cell wall biosynthesis